MKISKFVIIMICLVGYDVFLMMVNLNLKISCVWITPKWGIMEIFLHKVFIWFCVAMLS